MTRAYKLSRYSVYFSLLGSAKDDERNGLDGD
jgi:hypothetical protein